MAVEDIFRALDKQAAEDCKALLDHAHEQSEWILDEARAQAEQIRIDRLAQIEQDLGVMRNMKTNAAKLDAKKRASAERERLIQEAFSLAEARAKEVRDRPGYAEVFERLLSEALEGCPEGDVVIHADPRDAELAQNAKERVAPTASVALDLNSAGGAKVSMRDGTVCRVNTIESRFAKARRVAKWDVATAFFGD